MADRTALGCIGAMLGVAATLVVMIGAIVVTDHIAGQLAGDDTRIAALPQSAR